MHRALIVVFGFVLAGIGGLGAYFLPVLQTAASSTTISDGLPNLNPIDRPTQPSTVLLLGSDDDSKFVADRLDTQSMILLRVDPGHAGRAGLALTPAKMGCSQPSVSPDETSIVMVCDRGSNQHSDVVVAPLDLNALAIGPPTTLVGEQLVASPAFSPDGKTVGFLAPDSAGGHFWLAG